MTDKSLPKSTKLTIIAFEEVIRRNEVVEAVSKFRKLIGIPPEGIEFTEEDKKELEDPLMGPMNCALYIPMRLPVSKEFLDYVENSEVKHKNKIGNFRLTIVNTSRSLVASKGYTREQMWSLMRLYVIFNKVIDIPLRMFNYEDDLLRIEHLPDTLDDYGRNDQYLLECMYDHFEEVSRKYPVAIYINPEATQNQVKDFISKKWSLIQSHRDKDLNLYSGKRTKRRQVVNDFIYDHRNLTLAKIRRLLAEKGEFLDDGHIGKVLSLEKKKRKLIDNT